MSKRTRLVGDLLQQGPTLKQLLARSKQQAQLLERVRTLLPAPLQGHCTAAILKQNQLLLYTDASAWASRLRYLSRDLTRRLGKQGMGINKVTVRVMLNARPARTEPRPGRRLSAENAALLDQTAEGIADPKLSSALRRLSRHRR